MRKTQNVLNCTLTVCHHHHHHHYMTQIIIIITPTTHLIGNMKLACESLDCKEKSLNGLINREITV